MASQTPTPSKMPPSAPLIPEKFLDIPSQRLYFLSLGLLCQSIKLMDYVWSISSSESRMAICRKWLLVDLLYCVILSQLRIPRLHYTKASVLLQVILLWLLDGLLFGGITINLAPLFGGSGPVFNDAGYSDAPSTLGFSSLLNLIAPMTFGLLTSTSSDSHLLGEHTVRMSPISTAHLNPQNLNYCISPTSGFILIPVVLNNTNLAGLRYTLTPLGHSGQNTRVETHEIAAREFKNIDNAYHAQMHAATQAPPSRNTDEYDEYDDDEAEVPVENAHSGLQRSQSLVHIQISKPGIIRLERVYDSSNTDARLVLSQAVVVPCPSVQFAKDEGPHLEPIRCEGQKSDPELRIKVYGVPPLSLRWLQSVDGRREQYLVEGIEGDHKDNPRPSVVATPDPHEQTEALIPSSYVPTAQDIIVPLTISLEQPGAYLYALEEIIDGVGNTIRVENELASTEVVSTSSTATTRSYIVLQKPAISFSHCSTDLPISFLMGSEATINFDALHTTNFDKPWELQLQYQPHANEKRHKSWKKTRKYDGDRSDLALRVNAPGEYRITGFQGRYCTGTVLAPDTCKVVQKPLPSTEIEWRRIHECSGDTGVSASLILHGTPPFQIYYRVQRDKEQPRELSQSITSSRYELKLQPERSGHYVFTFVAISDANYRKIELQGPSIDQVIHPVASADFADSHGMGRGKRLVSSCSGDTVDINVELRGTGPWNLEVQIIGPQQAETLQIQGIHSPKKTIQIPIPKELQKTGGSFEIALVSVEDDSKCKRPLKVPGIEVKVKRVVPLVQFYGSPDERRVTITESGSANLPLRLTGDGPWSVRYRHQESGKTQTTKVYQRNSALQVSNKGTYEIISVNDSQCPGHVVADAATYIVSWVSRPSARLSSSTIAVYEAHNGSHILQPICEGVNDHVDLELSGRPPFQIMYNIAQDSQSGGTRIIDQPTFNSIQPRTRFQLRTSTPRRTYYEVKQIGDASYPLTENRDTIIPLSERLLFEQQVSKRPTAKFRSRNRLTYCLNDAFVPTDASSQDGYVILEGTPPFNIELSVKIIASSQVKTERVTVPSHIWKLDLPSYSFETIGPHLISIEKVTDASNCEQAALDPLLRSIWVDVAETAAIIPFERREDICVGEVTQFQLEGIPPWSVGYKVNGKSYNQEVKTSPFSISQQSPGVFAVTSIAHQQKMCKAAVTDLRFKVHALPSAQVGHGKQVITDIHEGDQAEIVFTLVGEPPFTFTYQRSELPTKKGGPVKVLETHTVSRVQTHEYSVFSALEGTWTVTSISDRYCRYPPIQPDSVVERRK